MWNIRRILVAVDLREASLLAIERAFDLAAQFRSSLTILMVLQPGIDVGPRGFLTRAEAAAALSEIDRQVLAGLIASRKRTGVEVQIGLRNGPAAAEILAAAGEIEADLIVMGTHKRTGLARVLLGSVAQKVVRSSRVPVLVVHAKGQRADEALELDEHARVEQEASRTS